MKSKSLEILLRKYKIFFTESIDFNVSNGGRDFTLKLEAFLGLLKSLKGYSFMLCERPVLQVFSDSSD